MPTMYIFAMITGFMLNTCSKTARLEKLEDENHRLQMENEDLTKMLAAATQVESESETESTSS